MDRKINLVSQFSRVTEVYKFKNIDTKTADRVVLCTLSTLDAQRAYLKVVEVQSTKVELKYTKIQLPDQPSEVSCVEVSLSTPLPAGETTTLETLSVYYNVQTAYPAEIRQADSQLMVYHDNLYVLSPYQVSAQTTEVVLPNGNVKSYTEEKPVTKADSKIKYGRYDMIKAFSLKELNVHFEQTKPFKQVATCEREIQVSHWGNIYVEETYEIKNGGAKFVGPFSRLKFAHNYGGKANSFRELRARLPHASHSLYFVDLIGNISSSNTRRTSSETILDLELRYPLMGGWKEDFTIGYSLPLKGFLFKTRSGRNKLVMDFNSPIDDLYIQDLTVKIVLPEGSNSIKLALPYEVEQHFDTKYTYLDVAGRPVLVLKKQNVVPEHSTKFDVEYSTAAFSWMFEPFLLISVYFAFFVTVITVNRLEFTISKDERWREAKNKEKLAGAVQALNSLLDEQCDILSEVEDLADKLADSSEVESTNKDKAALETKLRDWDAKSTASLKDIEAISARVAGQAKEIVEKAKAQRAKYLKLVTDKADALKKGTSIQEAEKKLAASKKQLAESNAEFKESSETFFTPY